MMVGKLSTDRDRRNSRLPKEMLRMTHPPAAASSKDRQAFESLAYTDRTLGRLRKGSQATKRRLA